jgi:imidazoleglycerol-phosphate dehydratase
MTAGEQDAVPGRRAEVHRTTRETDIKVSLDLDGSGVANISTGIGLYDHLLESFAHHSLIDLAIEANGDLERDEHHTVEDVALALGQALSEALGDRRGIVRFGEASVPMDEAIARAVVDISGRPYAVLDLRFRGEKIGELSTQMIPHALESFVRTSGVTLHLKARGRNDHHVAEAAFKALARAIRLAVAQDPRRSGVPSTKGTLG